MRNYKITLQKILGKDKYKEFVDFTLNNIRSEYGNIKPDEEAELINVNEQTLLITSIQKARDLKNEEILKTLKCKDKKTYKYFITEDLAKFMYVYKEYVDLIIQFAK